VQLVGLFVNASAQEIQTVLDSVPLDVLQLHGDETLSNANKLLRNVSAVGTKRFKLSLI
jgi:phosphoribosylanthranilate isomerase